jgi:hypothetical protein
MTSRAPVNHRVQQASRRRVSESPSFHSGSASVSPAERIAIVGCGRSGKSHLARVLADRLDITLAHLNVLYYDKEWKAAGPGDVRQPATRTGRRPTGDHRRELRLHPVDPPGSCRHGDLCRPARMDLPAGNPSAQAPPPQRAGHPPAQPRRRPPEPGRRGRRSPSLCPGSHQPEDRRLRLHRLGRRPYTCGRPATYLGWTSEPRGARQTGGFCVS